MSLIARRKHLIEQINEIQDEVTLELLEETLSFHTRNNASDITDGLSAKQLLELQGLVNEPDEQNTVGEDEFKLLFARWNTK